MVLVQRLSLKDPKFGYYQEYREIAHRVNRETGRTAIIFPEVERFLVAFPHLRILEPRLQRQKHR